MKILVISGYPAWNKVSKGLMPSFHLFGIHEMVDHYEYGNGTVRGILKDNVLGGGYVDFYLWQSGKKYILPQVGELVRKSREYDIIYDQLNRCSIFLGALKKWNLLNCKLLTVMHHPPYNLQLTVSDSDAYVFFNEDYRKLAVAAKPKKTEKYFVNEWHPDMRWYESVKNTDAACEACDAFYIDTGKSRRDRPVLIKAAEESGIRVDYAGDRNSTEGNARSYAMDLKDDIAMINRILKYKAEIIPVQESKKQKVGPLGITSFMDCVALGLPVIASDNVCFAKDIEKYGLGLLYKTGDSDSLKAAMKKLYEDTAFYSSCRENLNKYSNETMDDYSKKLVDILYEIRK